MYEVFLKELKELLRDRKTLMFVVALPLLIFPIIFALIGFLASQAALEAKQEVHTYAIVNAQYAEPFAKEVFFHKSFMKGEVIAVNKYLAEAFIINKLPGPHNMQDIGFVLDMLRERTIRCGQFNDTYCSIIQYFFTGRSANGYFI